MRQVNHSRDPQALEYQRLAWFSPAFPVGGYAYSHGIEMAVAANDIHDGATLVRWIGDILTHGAGWNDAVLIKATLDVMQAPISERDDGLAELAELGSALAQSSERRLETEQQGASFIALVQQAWPHGNLPPEPPSPLPFPVAVGIAGGAHGQPAEPLIAAFLQSFAGNLMAAGIRLAVIGQTAAQARLAELRPVIAPLATKAAQSSIADLGGCAMRADLMSLRHETLETRLFRS